MVSLIINHMKVENMKMLWSLEKDSWLY